ncbi:TRAP-type C4-dicarboxylate transport system permease small subunit [Tepidamorphus gemmatus]|uniref:TRAP transporter small permease protein n=1 Tax=Tepidamorphus gemmatus TaxID=747076 RepID=A0A4R3MFY8_9HYPH|nr:TRAP transporter small permease subunit [Tepidamorphus gemmatus]TCT12446.1 TRAP-type C4-dicarboxylate transport system permease small subunit [Tepidamorphus gemmatus]
MLRALGRTEAVLAAVLLVAMAVLIFVGGVARMVRHPLNWTTDFATCFFAWAAFLAADVAWRRDSLLSIDVIAGRLEAPARRWLRLVNLVLICFFLIYVIWAGTRLAILSSARSFQGIPWISYSWVTMSLPVGATLLLLTTGTKIVALLREARSDDPSEGRRG